ncbi:Protein CBG28050 [Caenorhabditis briggsae]|uniref:Protein CBG28050 n=1 Tax=Caenorhabditis briggsae TaxID=6238 RepID=B6IGP0_CAEBR|nr:Protein CBG28050 [Caenorhabditis briggsae]CAR99070.1 Protein CBG28050 [Caenorhabditis briggsae]
MTFFQNYKNLKSRILDFFESSVNQRLSW